MRILFLLLATLLIFIQIIPGNAYEAPDTQECRSIRGFCKYGNCPGRTRHTGGTCQWETLLCCKSIYAP